MNELDQALTRIHPYSFEYGTGLTSHASMVAGALEALGHSALIEAFLDVYLPRLELLGEGREIPREGQPRAFGSGGGEDWLRTFAVEMESVSWRDLLRSRLPELLPGALGAAMHGPDRLAHAVRSLEKKDSAERRTELLFGLAYWASRYTELSAEAGLRADKGRGPAIVLRELDPVPLESSQLETISEAMGYLDKEVGYCASLERADLDSGSASEFLSGLCAEASGQYLCHPQARLPYLHGIVGASAFRCLIPYLEADPARLGLGAALQCVTSIHSLYGQPEEAFSPEPEMQRLSGSWDEMRYRAACSVEEHVIELTEVCWREDQICPDERFRMAAADAILELGFSRGGRGG